MPGLLDAALSVARALGRGSVRLPEVGGVVGCMECARSCRYKRRPERSRQQETTLGYSKRLFELETKSLGENINQKSKEKKREKKKGRSGKGGEAVPSHDLGAPWRHFPFSPEQSISDEGK